MLAVWDFLATILLNAFVQFIFFYFYAIHYIEFKVVLVLHTVL